MKAQIALDVTSHPKRQGAQAQSRSKRKGVNNFAAAMLAVAARIIRRKPLAEPRPPRATAVEWPNVPHEAVVVL